MNKKYKIVLTDDEALFRKGLHRILSDCGDCEVLFEAHHGIDLLAKLKRAKNLPDIILLDMNMPEMDGVDTLKELNKEYPDIKVIILTSHYNATLILKMIELGASAFMPKNVDLDELLKTIKDVGDKGFHYDDNIVKLLREKMKMGKDQQKKIIDELTKREKEILLLICDQCTNKEIAEKLFISKRTVEGHRNKMLEKTLSKNTVGLIIYAIERNIISLKVSDMLSA